MKFKTMLAEIALQELGETTDAYDWYEESTRFGKVYYGFYSGEIKYRAMFKPVGDGITVEFAPESGEVDVDWPNEDRFGVETNQGNQFRIMATVLEMAKHVWENDVFEDENLTHFVFKPSGDGKKDKQRAKLYKQFVKKQFPYAQIEKEGSRYKVYP